MKIASHCGAYFEEQTLALRLDGLTVHEGDEALGLLLRGKGLVPGEVGHEGGQNALVGESL
jgi:hypothetical protein